MFGYIVQFFNRLLNYIFGYSGDEVPASFVRAFSPSENNMEFYNRLEVLMVTRTVFIESKKPIDEKVIRAVLEQVIKKFPVLRLKGQNCDGKLYWKEMGEVIPNLEIDTSGDWISRFQENSRKVFDTENGPLWRVTWITNVETDHMDKAYFNHQYALLFGFHHSILDAKSSLLILNEMQQLLNVRIKEGSLAVQDLVPVEALAGPLESYLKLEFSIKEKLINFVLLVPGLSLLLRKLVKIAFFLNFKSQENLFLKHVAVPVNSEKCSSVKIIPFSKEETKQLLVACKSHGVTVQSALQTASAMALCNLIKNPILSQDSAALAQSLTVEVACSLNMKTVLPQIPKDDIGCFISLLQPKLQIDDDAKFWTLATDSRAQLHKNQLSNAMRFIKMIQFFRQLQLDLTKCFSPASCGRFPGLMLSYTNLGNCSFLNLTSSAEARINGHVSGSSEHVFGPLFAHSAVTILNRLNWNVVYFPNIHSEKTVNFYAAETKRIICKAMNDASF